MRGAALLISATLLAGCSAPSYFPPSVLTAVEPCQWGNGREGWPVMSEHQSTWYSSHLRAAREPRLGETPPPYVVGGFGVLRFTWLRTFDQPVIVRIEATRDGDLQMTATELSGAGGYDPGHIARRIERRLSAEEAVALTTVVAEADILNQPAAQDCPVNAETGEVTIYGDGAQWIFEANGPDGYRFIDRHSHHHGPEQVLGRHMLGLTG